LVIFLNKYVYEKRNLENTFHLIFFPETSAFCDLESIPLSIPFAVGSRVWKKKIQINGIKKRGHIHPRRGHEGPEWV
jgi:hypothetical protein